MKVHLANVSLALLSAVFLLGCQDSGSGPVGPDGVGPQLHVSPKHPDGHGGGDDGDTGGDNPGSPFYDITFAGDITTNPDQLRAGGTVGGEVGFYACCGLGGEKLILASALLFDVGDAADKCFGGGISLTITADNWWAKLGPEKRDMNQVEARFAFRAKDKDGINPVRYKLILAPGTAAGNDDVFPPEPGEFMTVTYSENTLFKINASRKSEKNGCASDGFIPLKNAITVLVAGIT